MWHLQCYECRSYNATNVADDYERRDLYTTNVAGDDECVPEVFECPVFPG